MDTKFLRMLVDNFSNSAEELMANVEVLVKRGDKETAIAAATAGIVMSAVSDTIKKTIAQISAKEQK